MLIKFNLSISVENIKVCKQDSIFLCGSSNFLGAWNLNKAIEMKMKSNEDNGSLCSATSNSSLCSIENFQEIQTLDFEAFVHVNDPSELSELESIHYKYFIAQKTSQKDKMFLKQIEFGWRKFTIDSNAILLINDKWPYYDEDVEKPVRVDQGWLLKEENEIQFHFYDNPLQLWNVDESKLKNYAIEIKPMKAANGLIELKDYTLSHLDFDETQYIKGKMTKFNALNSPNVYSSFRFRSHEKPTNIIFQISIYEFNDSGVLNEKQIATSFYKVNKSLIENCLIDIDLSLLDQQQIIGSLKAEICLITCIEEETQNCNLTKNFNYHFNKSCISIGHRGMGKTFDADTLQHTAFIENTIDSFREAFLCGAQMVEFDIVLTKDKIPIIYHDFTFCIDSHDTEDSNMNKYLDVAVNQMTYDEIKRSKVYAHTVRNKACKPDETSDKYTSKQMFPTLREMSTQLDTQLGFNVEIKYPQDIEDSSKNEVGRLIKWLNRNEYADTIIKELYECIKDNRCVILSTFDPLLCSMLRIKQNRFPVLFLTTGITQKWVPFKDFRCKNTQISINYAKSEGLHGIVAHTEELSKNSHLIRNLLKIDELNSANFLSYAWGDELNESDKRKLYKKTGINGIIYDRIQDSDKLEDLEAS